MKYLVLGKLMFGHDVIGEWNLLHLVQLSQVKTVACFLPVTPYLLAVETCSSLWRLVCALVVAFYIRSGTGAGLVANRPD